MRNIQIKEVMTPIQDYETINENHTLYDAFRVLNPSGRDGQKVHRDLIVVDDEGTFKGKVTMIDIFRALEPNYKKLNVHYTGGTLTRDFVLKAIQDFDLWMEPMKDLCERGSQIKISKVMHVPEPVEFVFETDSLEKALHSYVMDVHQPLVVKDEDGVTGILRFEDLYQVIADQMLTCPVPA